MQKRIGIRRQDTPKSKLPLSRIFLSYQMIPMPIDSLMSGETCIQTINNTLISLIDSTAESKG
jgi:hypothetical protein